jgi:PAS domain-containing protein
MDTGRGTADDPDEKLKLLGQELARLRSDLEASQKLSARLTEENETLRIYADLRQWEARFRLAIDTIPGLTWFCRADGSAEFLNNQWCAYAGVTMEEALGWNWMNVIHPDDLAGLVEHWRKTIQSARPDEHEARMRRFDG